MHFKSDAVTVSGSWRSTVAAPAPLSDQEFNVERRRSDFHSGLAVVVVRALALGGVVACGGVQAGTTPGQAASGANLSAAVSPMAPAASPTSAGTSPSGSPGASPAAMTSPGAPTAGSAAGTPSPTAGSTAAAASFDWKAIDQATGVSGKEQPGGARKWSFPRSDVRVTVDAIPIKPALALGGVRPDRG